MTQMYKPDPENIAEVLTPVGAIKRHVVCAANIYSTNKGEQIIVCASRHGSKAMHCVLNELVSAGIVDVRKCEAQGFIDQWDNWMDRDEAMFVVKQNGQPMRDGVIELSELYSENLY